MDNYEVNVTVTKGTPPKNVSVPTSLTFIVKAESYDEAKTRALGYAEKRVLAQPRIYKNAKFSCVSPCVRLAFTKDDFR